MTRRVDGQHPFGVDMRMSVGRDMLDVLLGECGGCSGTDVADPARIPCHDDVGEQRQTRRDGGDLLEGPAMAGTNCAGIDRALKAVGRFALGEQCLVDGAEFRIAEVGCKKAGQQKSAEGIACLESEVAARRAENAQGCRSPNTSQSWLMRRSAGAGPSLW